MMKIRMDTAQNPVPYVLEAFIGICAGALVGLIVSLIFRKRTLVLADALLGALGFLGGAIGTNYVPWHRNTLTYRVGDAIVSTTKYRYQHPYRVALALAILLPAAFELVRITLQSRKK